MEVYKLSAEALCLHINMNDRCAMLNRLVMCIILLCEAWKMTFSRYLMICVVLLAKVQNDGIILNQPSILLHLSFGLNNHAEWSNLI